MGQLLRPLTGQPAELLPFEAVREGLHLRHIVDRGIQDVPLARIVGSLGRERDFTRAFLPREEALRERYANSEVTDVQAARHFRFFFRPRRRFGDRLRSWWRRLRKGS